MKENFKKEHISEELIRYYLEELHLNQKISLGEIGRNYPINRYVLMYRAKKYGISCVNHSKLYFDYSYFETIDTEEKAYWLGFIAADGCVMKRKKSVSNFELGLKLSDKPHLEKFKKSISWEGVVKSDHFRCRISLGDIEFCKHLVDKGITPRKSLTLQFPTEQQVPVEFQRHFIRGYYDGDGCINSPLNMSIAVNILGTEWFLQKMLEISNLQTALTTDKRNTNISMFNINGEKARNFLKWLYEDATIYLERKFYRYKIHLIRFNRDFKLEDRKMSELHYQYLDDEEKEILKFLLEEKSAKKNSL